MGVSLLAVACNNEASDSVEKADSANEAKLDREGTPMADAASADFLVEAANGGMAEVEMARLAQERATNASVKSYATTLLNDHTAANDQVKALAASRNVTLPTAVSDEKKKDMEDLSKEKGASFDKKYMEMMVDDHEKDINKFEKASGDVKDTDVKAFIDNTLPKLRMHLDSAKDIRDKLK